MLLVWMIFLPVFFKYSVAAGTNIALGAECCASSEDGPRFACEKAVDGNNKSVNSLRDCTVENTPLQVNDYHSFREGVGLWIKLNFGGPFLLQRQIRIMDRYWKVHKNRGLLLVFSDGSSQTIRLTRHGDGLFWDTVTIDPVVTVSVNITVQSVYSRQNNGFNEIEIFGVPVPADSIFQRSCSDVGVSLREFGWNDDRKIVSGTIEPENGLTQEQFVQSVKCFQDCITIPGCLKVVINVHSGECRLVFLDCVLTKLYRKDNVIWTPHFA